MALACAAFQIMISCECFILIFRMLLDTVLTFAISFTVLLDILASDSCERDELDGILQFKKMSVARCIAECLELISQPDRCRFDASTGKALEKFNNLQKDGCPKCYYPFEKYETFKAIAGLAKRINTTICGKKLNYGALGIGSVFEFGLMDCSTTGREKMHWLPMDYNEVRCIIEGLPEKIQKLGKLRVLVYKSVCSKEFFFCATENPRSLRGSFLAAELNKTHPAYPNGTCAHFEYKMQQKKVVDIRLEIADCREKVYMFCELKD
ncbi:Hypothetical predicted protein [Cloeon dipterum]|uniref:Uncharacterized protein n=1 Tax=Cloeon dipterum TaxID=197152 RepID=A0A8S1DA33_9INSE|nr:Hypothetical predicted protein [Cloeon dipterum]